MRELPAQSELLKVRDTATIIVLPESGWYCLWCENPVDDYLGTVDWIVGPDGHEFGRCRICGQKYVLNREED